MGNKFDSYPYLIHTNRELSLMLKGQKPMAVFAHQKVEGFTKANALSHQDFTTHVASGLFAEHCRTLELGGPSATAVTVDYYFYTATGHDWRANAYWQVISTLHSGRGWCAALERLEGELLGYTDAQNDYHIAQMFPDAPCQKAK